MTEPYVHGVTGTTLRPKSQRFVLDAPKAPTVRDPQKLQQNNSIIESYRRRQESSVRREEQSKPKGGMFKRLLAPAAKGLGKALEYTSGSELAYKIPGIGDDLEAAADYIPGVRTALAIATNPLTYATGGVGAGLAAAAGAGAATFAVSDRDRGLGLDIAGVDEKYEEMVAGAAGGLVGGAGLRSIKVKNARAAAKSAEANIQRIENGTLQLDDVMHTADNRTFFPRRPTADAPDNPLDWNSYRVKNPANFKYDPDELAWVRAADDAAAAVDDARPLGQSVMQKMSSTLDDDADLIAEGVKAKSSGKNIFEKIGDVAQSTVMPPGFKHIRKLDRGIGQAVGKLAPDALEPAVSAMARPSTMMGLGILADPEGAKDVVKKVFEVDKKIGLAIARKVLPKTDWDLGVKGLHSVNLEGVGAELFRPTNFINFSPAGMGLKAGMKVASIAAAKQLSKRAILEGTGNAGLMGVETWVNGGSVEQIVTSMGMGFGAGAVLPVGMDIGGHHLKPLLGRVAASQTPEEAAALAADLAEDAQKAIDETADEAIAGLPEGEVAGAMVAPEADMVAPGPDIELPRAAQAVSEPRNPGAGHEPRLQQAIDDPESNLNRALTETGETRPNTGDANVDQAVEQWLAGGVSRGSLDLEQAFARGMEDPLAKAVYAHFEPVRAALREIYPDGRVPLYHSSVEGARPSTLVSAGDERIARAFMENAENRVLRKADVDINDIVAASDGTLGGMRLEAPDGGDAPYNDFITMRRAFEPERAIEQTPPVIPGRSTGAMDAGDIGPQGSPPTGAEPDLQPFVDMPRQAQAVGEARRLDPLEFERSPERLQKIADDTVANGGASIDIRTGEAARGEGHIVSDPRYTRTVSVEEFQRNGPGLLKNFVERNRDILDDDETFLGTWVDDGQVHLDVSKRVPDEEAAHIAATEGRQKAVYDLGKGEVVPTRAQANIEPKAPEEPLGGVGRYGQNTDRQDALGRPLKDFEQPVVEKGSPQQKSEAAEASRLEEESKRVKAVTGKDADFSKSDPAPLDPFNDPAYKLLPSSGGVLEGMPREYTLLNGETIKLDNIDTINMWREDMKTKVRQGDGARFWYEDSSRAMMEMVGIKIEGLDPRDPASIQRHTEALLEKFGGDVNKADAFVQAIAITSPQTKVDENTREALVAFYDMLVNEPSMNIKTDAAHARLSKALRGEDWGSLKTNRFYFAHLKFINPEKYARLSKSGATIDVWMARGMGITQKSKTAYRNKETGAYIREKPSKATMKNFEVVNDVEVLAYAPTKLQYTNMAREITLMRDQLNAELGPDDIKWTDDQVQAALWTAQKMNAEGTPVDVAGFDYSDGLRQHMASLEMTFFADGRLTRMFPELANASKEQLDEILPILRRVLEDENGNNDIAQVFSLLGVDETVARTADGAPVVGREVIAPLGAGSVSRPQVHVNAQRVLDGAAAFFGRFFGLENSGWTRPIRGVDPSLHNAVELKAGSLTTDEMIQLNQYLDANGVNATIVSGPTGIHILNNDPALEKFQFVKVQGGKEQPVGFTPQRQAGVEATRLEADTKRRTAPQKFALTEAEEIAKNKLKTTAQKKAYIDKKKAAWKAKQDKLKAADKKAKGKTGKEIAREQGAAQWIVRDEKGNKLTGPVKKSYVAGITKFNADVAKTLDELGLKVEQEPLRVQRGVVSMEDGYDRFITDAGADTDAIRGLESRMESRLEQAQGQVSKVLARGSEVADEAAPSAPRVEADRVTDTAAGAVEARGPPRAQSVDEPRADVQPRIISRTTDNRRDMTETVSDYRVNADGTLDERVRTINTNPRGNSGGRTDQPAYGQEMYNSGWVRDKSANLETLERNGWKDVDPDDINPDDLGKAGDAEPDVEVDPEVQKFIDDEASALEQLENPSAKAARATMKRLEAKGLETSGIEDALNDLESTKRADFDERDDFLDAKADAWDTVVQAVNDVEAPPRAADPNPRAQSVDEPTADGRVGSAEEARDVTYGQPDQRGGTAGEWGDAESTVSIDALKNGIKVEGDLTIASINPAHASILERLAATRAIKDWVSISERTVDRIREAFKRTQYAPDSVEVRYGGNLLERFVKDDNVLTIRAQFNTTPGAKGAGSGAAVVQNDILAQLYVLKTIVADSSKMPENIKEALARQIGTDYNEDDLLAALMSETMFHEMVHRTVFGHEADFHNVLKAFLEESQDDFDAVFNDHRAAIAEWRASGELDKLKELSDDANRIDNSRSSLISRPEVEPAGVRDAKSSNVEAGSGRSDSSSVPESNQGRLESDVPSREPLPNKPEPTASAERGGTGTPRTSDAGGNTRRVKPPTADAVSEPAPGFKKVTRKPSVAPIKNADDLEFIETYRVASDKVSYKDAGPGKAFLEMKENWDENRLVQHLSSIEDVVEGNFIDNAMRKLGQKASNFWGGKRLVEVIGGKAGTARNPWEKSVVAYHIILGEGESRKTIALNWLKGAKDTFPEVRENGVSTGKIDITDVDGNVVRVNVDDVLSNPSKYKLNDAQKAYVDTTHKIIDDLVEEMRANGIDIKELGVEKRGEHYFPRYVKNKGGDWEIAGKAYDATDANYVKRGLGQKGNFQKVRTHDTMASGQKSGVVYARPEEALEVFFTQANYSIAGRKLLASIVPEMSTTGKALALAEHGIDVKRFNKKTGKMEQVRVLAPLFASTKELAKAKKAVKQAQREVEAARRGRRDMRTGSGNRKLSMRELTSMANETPEVKAAKKALEEAKRRKGANKADIDVQSPDDVKLEAAFKRAKDNYDRLLKRKNAYGQVGGHTTEAPGIPKEQITAAHQKMVDARNALASDNIMRLGSQLNDTVASARAQIRAAHNIGRGANISQGGQAIADAEIRLDTARAKFDSAKRNAVSTARDMRAIIAQKSNAMTAPRSIFGLEGDILPVNANGEVKLGRANVMGLQGKLFPDNIADDLNAAFKQAELPGIFKTVADFNNHARLARTSTDFGYLFIQGLPILASHPIAFAKAAHQAVRALFDPEGYSRWLATKNATVKDMYPFAGAFTGSEYFTATKGGFIKQWADTKGGLDAPHKAARHAAGFTLQRFAVSFDAFLDASKVSMWEGMAPHMKTRADKEAYGRLLRNMTGTTDTGRLAVSQQQRAVEGLLMFSPRFTRSVFALAAMAAEGGPARMEAFKSIGMMMAAATVFYAGVKTAMYESGMSEDPFEWQDLDPSQGARFMSIKVGDNYIGLGGSMRGASQLMVNIGKSLASPERFISTDSTSNDKSNPFLKFGRGKLSPFAGSAVDLAVGKTVIGDDVSDRKQWLARVPDQFLPFAVGTVMETEGGIDQKLGALAATGVGFRQFPEGGYEDLDARVRELTKDKTIEGWSSLTSVQKNNLMEKHPELQKMLDKAETANWTKNRDLTQEYDDKKAALAARWLKTQGEHGGEKVTEDDLTSKEYRDQLEALNIGLRAARAERNKGKNSEFGNPKNARQKLMKQYYDEVDYEKFVRPDGSFDFDAKDAAESQFMAALTPEARKIIIEETSGTSTDPLEKKLKEDNTALAPYWDLRDTVAQKMGFASALEVSQQHVRVQKRYDALLTVAQQKWRRANPDLEENMLIWGRISTPISEQDMGGGKSKFGLKKRKVRRTNFGLK